jgi:hypothetical protein
MLPQLLEFFSSQPEAFILGSTSICRRTRSAASAFENSFPAA